MEQNLTRNLLLWLALCVSLVATADNPFYDTPSGYQTKSCALVASATSACNQGTEPFSVFIKKWNTSAQFRENRVKVTANTPEYIGDTPSERKQALINRLEFLESYIGGFPLKPHKLRKSNGCRSYATYYTVTADRVAFRNSEECDEFGGSAGMVGFERIEGKWYLTYIELAG